MPGSGLLVRRGAGRIGHDAGLASAVGQASGRILQGHGPGEARDSSARDVRSHAHAADGRPARHVVDDDHRLESPRGSAAARPRRPHSSPIAASTKGMSKVRSVSEGLDEEPRPTFGAQHTSLCSTSRPPLAVRDRHHPMAGEGAGARSGSSSGRPPGDAGGRGRGSRYPARRCALRSGPGHSDSPDPPAFPSRIAVSSGADGVGTVVGVDLGQTGSRHELLGWWRLAGRGQRIGIGGGAMATTAVDRLEPRRSAGEVDGGTFAVWHPARRMRAS